MDYKFIDFLGNGGAARVLKIRLNIDNKIYALKQSLETKYNDMIINEIRLFKEVNNSCKNLVFFHGYFSSKQNKQEIMNLLIENCDYGSITDIMAHPKKKIDINELEISSILYNILNGLIYLKSKNWIHRDIKARNILINKDGEVKIADFGICVKYTPNKMSRAPRVGSPYWMAPEVINRQEFDFSCDIWSLGILCIELIDQFPPFSEKESIEVMRFLEHANDKTLKNEYLKYFKKNKKVTWSEEFIEFTLSCLNVNRNKRPTAEELLQTKFIKKSENSGISRETHIFNFLRRNMGKKFIEPVKKKRNININIPDATSNNKSFDDISMESQYNKTCENTREIRSNDNKVGKIKGRLILDRKKIMRKELSPQKESKANEATCIQNNIKNYNNVNKIEENININNSIIKPNNIDIKIIIKEPKDDCKNSPNSYIIKNKDSKGNLNQIIKNNLNQINNNKIICLNQQKNQINLNVQKETKPSNENKKINLPNEGEDDNEYSDEETIINDSCFMECNKEYFSRRRNSSCCFVLDNQGKEEEVCSHPLPDNNQNNLRQTIKMNPAVFDSQNYIFVRNFINQRKNKINSIIKEVTEESEQTDHDQKDKESDISLQDKKVKINYNDFLMNNNACNLNNNANSFKNSVYKKKIPNNCGLMNNLACNGNRGQENKNCFMINNNKNPTGGINNKVGKVNNKLGPMKLIGNNK